jgi:hypothetical protein
MEEIITSTHRAYLGWLDGSPCLYLALTHTWHDWLLAQIESHEPPAFEVGVRWLG